MAFYSDLSWKVLLIPSARAGLTPTDASQSQAFGNQGLRLQGWFCDPVSSEASGCSSELGAETRAWLVLSTRLWDFIPEFKKSHNDTSVVLSGYCVFIAGTFPHVCCEKGLRYVRTDRMASENPRFSVIAAYYYPFPLEPTACSLCVQATPELIPPGPFTLSRVVCH